MASDAAIFRGCTDRLNRSVRVRPALLYWSLKVLLVVKLIANLLKLARAVTLDRAPVNLVHFFYALVVAGKVLTKVDPDLVEGWRVFNPFGELVRDFIMQAR